MTDAADAPPRATENLLRELGSDPRDGLRIGGVAAAEIADRYGTPLYVYDAGVMRRRYAAVVEQLGVEVLFALKANPCAAVAKVFADLGAGVDVASAGEVHIAARAGFRGERVQFAGPGKTRAELQLAVRRGFQRINIESVAEYEALAAIAKRRAAGGEPPPSVAIRVNPRLGVAGARMRTGGGPSKFGVDAERVEALAQRIHGEGLVRLDGLHCYAATQMFDAEAWLQGVRALFGLAGELEAHNRFALANLNLGGGFGTPCFDGEVEFDLQAAAHGLRRIVDEDLPVSLHPRRLCVELGRYLTAPAGVFLTRVDHVKDSRGRRFAILDGGMHQFGAAAGLGSVVRRRYPIVSATAPRSADTLPQSLGGPLCTPADEFGTAELPELVPGDLVAVLAAGAYGLTFSPTLFLSHPAPREVLVDAGRAHLVREAGRPEDVLRGQFLPDEAPRP